MSTQAALASAVESALTSGGYTPAPSPDAASWPSWAVVGAGATPWVLAGLESSDDLGTDGGDVGMTSIALVFTAIAGNPFDAHAGQRASMTTSRALRVLGEALGDTVAARLVYTGDSRDEIGSGLWRVRVRFTVYQTDTY